METYFGLYLRGAMSAVTGIYRFRHIFCPEIFLPQQTVHSLMKCRMMAFHQFASVKNIYRKIYVKIEMQPNTFFKLFLVPYMYAFTCFDHSFTELLGNLGSPLTLKRT